MALDSNIPLMAKGFDPFDMGEKGVQLGNLLTQQKTTQTMQDLYNQTQGDPVKMMDLAKGSKMYALIAPQIQQQEMAKQKLLLDNQKTQSEIYKNTGDATKSMTQSQGFGLDNAGKTLSAMQTAIGYGAQSGDKNAVFQALDMARSSGLLTPEQYKTEASRVSGFQSPNDVKQYALSSQIANSKDPAQYLVQTANNVANNATTERGQDISANTAGNKLQQDQKQFDQTMDFNQAKEAFNRKEGDVKQFGDKVYFIDKLGGVKQLTNIPPIQGKGNGVPKLSDNALKQVNEANSQLEQSNQSSIKIGGLIDKLNNGGLEISPTNIAGAKVRSWIGQTTPNDLAVDQLKTAVNEGVNNILMQAKGTQTEGDAQRAAQVIAANPIHDKNSALQALNTLKAVQDSHVRSLNQNINTVYDNYGISRPNQQKTNQPPNQGGKVFSSVAVTQAAKQRGVSEAQIRQEITSRGGQVQ